MSFEDVVARQAGVVSLGQAVAHGYSADRVHRRARERRWRRLHPGVYLVGGHRLTDEARVRAAWLWAGETSVVAGPAAAQWHGMLDSAADLVDLTVPSAAKPRPRAGVRLRRRDLARDDVVERRGIRVTCGGLTALETALVRSDGSAFLDRALQRYVPFPDVYAAYCRNLGCSGSAGMGRLLVAAADRADSVAERVLVGLLRTAKIRGWVLGHPVGPGRRHGRMIVEPGTCGASAQLVSLARRSRATVRGRGPGCEHSPRRRTLA